MNTLFCQSCGMPMDSVNGPFATNADASENRDYCMYCFKDGAFTSECTMDEMIAFCVPHVLEHQPDMKEDEVRQQMKNFFPKLKRWQ